MAEEGRLPALSWHSSSVLPAKQRRIRSWLCLWHSPLYLVIFSSSSLSSSLSTFERGGPRKRYLFHLHVRSTSTTSCGCSCFGVAETAVARATEVAATPDVFQVSSAAAVVVEAFSDAAAWVATAASSTLFDDRISCWGYSLFLHLTTSVLSRRLLGDLMGISCPTTPFVVDGYDCSCGTSFFPGQNFEKCPAAPQNQQWDRRPSTIT